MRINRSALDRRRVSSDRFSLRMPRFEASIKQRSLFPKSKIIKREVDASRRRHVVRQKADYDSGVVRHAEFFERRLELVYRWKLQCERLAGNRDTRHLEESRAGNVTAIIARSRTYVDYHERAV